MRQRFSSQELFTLRNHIPIDILIEKVLMVPSKFSEGFFRFRCPLCGAFNTATNRDTNLARCFYCNKNFNTIEMVMAIRKTDFIESVRFLKQCHKTLSKNKGNCPAPTTVGPGADGLPSSACQDTEENTGIFNLDTPVRSQRKACEKPVAIGSILHKSLLHLTQKHHHNERNLSTPPALEACLSKVPPQSSIINRIERLEQQIESLFKQLQHLNAAIGIQNRSL